MSELKCPIEVQGRTVPCGKCNACLKSRKNDWSFRLQWETKQATNSYFITLTYDEKNCPWSSDGKIKARSLRRVDLIRLHKSLREANRRYIVEELKCEPPDQVMRYYSVGEYGTKTKRPHYHMILFNVHEEVIKRLDRIWNKGFVKVGEVNEKTIAYTAKYIIDIDNRTANTPVEYPFSIMSKNLGLNYLQKNKDFHKTEEDTPDDWRLFVYNGKFKQSLPRYYKNKIFDLAEREEIADRMSFRIAEKHLEESIKANSVGQLNYRQNQAKREHKDLSIKMKSQLKNTL